MELVFADVLDNQDWIEQIRQLMIAGDKEFIPPLSSRSSPTQASLQPGEGGSVEPYLQDMLKQRFVLAMEGQTVAGFMSYKTDYQSEEVKELPNLYASTCIVGEAFRGRGMMLSFYQAMLARYPQAHLYTRTWGTHYGHLKVLDKLGAKCFVRLPDHRGPGIDTVYYHRLPDHLRKV